MGFWVYIGAFGDPPTWLEDEKTERDCCCMLGPNSDGPSYECPTCGHIPHAVVEYAHMGGFARVIFADGPYKDKIDWIRCYASHSDPARSRLIDLPQGIRCDPIEGTISQDEMRRYAGDLLIFGSYRSDNKLLVTNYIERELNCAIDLEAFFRTDRDDTIHWRGRQIYQPDFKYPSPTNLYPYKLKRP